MTIPIGLQLYSVRQALAEDFAGVMHKVADAGYAGVEPALGHTGATPDEAAKLFQELGFEAPSTHAPLPLGDNKARVLDFAATIGCPRIISGRGPDNFKTLDLIKESCDLFNQAQAVAAENGLTFGIHNHWWEFEQVEGRYVYRVMLEHLDPAIFFQIDTYWVQTAGPDPAQVVKELGPRVPLLHIKDGPAVEGDPRHAVHVAVGDGVMDFHSIVQAAGDTVEWLIVELDRCATDMVEAVTKSCHYLVKEGLGHGQG